MVEKVKADAEKYTDERGKLSYSLIQAEFGVGKDKAIMVQKIVKKLSLG